MRREQDSDQAAAELKLPKVVDYLKKEGLMLDYENNDDEPKDITMQPLTFPTSRSERLQILTAWTSRRRFSAGLRVFAGLWDGTSYGWRAAGRSAAGVCGFRRIYPTREKMSSYFLGSVRITETESIIPVTVKQPDGSSKTKIRIWVRYFVSGKTRPKLLRCLYWTAASRRKASTPRTMKSSFCIISTALNHPDSSRI